MCTFVYKRPVDEISREGRRPHDHSHSALFRVERGREVRRLEVFLVRLEREDDRKRGDFEGFLHLGLIITGGKRGQFLGLENRPGI